MQPVEVKKIGPNVLAIDWDDGHKSVFAMDGLRKSCPCATCRAARASQQNSPLRVLSASETIPDDLELREAEIVGRYAIQFRWSDGHDTGIYSFNFLRQLCQCDLCKPKH
ncbi:MAG: gamma-butyrobetaine hydroxylase-like domain-containing protein [bacterium]